MVTPEERETNAVTLARIYDLFEYTDAVAIAQMVLEMVTERQPPLPEECDRSD